MNKLVSIIGMVVLAAIMSIGPAAAQTPTTNTSLAVLPIYSQDVLRESALKMITYGTRGVWANSIDWDYPGTLTGLSPKGDLIKI
ncbi:MAG: hypothetical protein PHS62_03005 [Patescibacteria group bacterium]|nr:hypothetical protein [Patescibacteria group bacterium]